MKKKLFSMLLCVALGVSLLAGCGGKQGSDKQTDSGNNNASSEEQSEDKENSNETVTEEEITITVGGWAWLDEHVPVIQREFEKKYPGIKIDFEMMQQEDYVNKLKVNLAAGTSWDIMMLEAGSLLNAVKNYCLPLNEYVEADWGSDWKNNYNETVISEVVGEDGVVYGLPEAVGLAGMLMYDTTKLEKYNMEIPVTYEELKAYCDALRADGDLPVVIGAKDGWISTDIFLVIANDIAPGKVRQADAGEIPWTDPDIVEAFSKWKQMFDDGIFQDGCLGVPQYPIASELFWKSNKGGALTEGDWSIGGFLSEDLKETANIHNYIVACMPDINGDGKTAGPLASTGTVYAINKDIAPEKLEAAWDLIRWYIGEEGQVVMNSQEVGMVSTPAFQGITIDRTSDCANYTNCMNEIPKLAEQVSGPRALNNVDAKAALEEVLQELGAGMSPQDAAAKVQSAME